MVKKVVLTKINIIFFFFACRMCLCNNHFLNTIFGVFRLELPFPYLKLKLDHIFRLWISYDLQLSW